MTSDEMFDAIIAQRYRLADTLEGLAEHEWNLGSLCLGWRVRDVVGHLLSILEIPLARFLWGAFTAGSFDRFADKVARQIGSREPSDLLATFRLLADKRSAPPIVGPIVPLSDVYIHSRDIERPLARPRRFEEDAARTVLEFVCGGKARGYVPSRRTRGLRFAATDLDWSIGEGPVVAGTSEAIMLGVTGRTSALDELSGAGVRELRQRLTAA